MTNSTKNTQKEVTLLTTKEVMSKLRCSRTFLHDLRKRKAIQFVKAGRKVLYEETAIQNFLKSNSKEVVNG